MTASSANVSVKTGWAACRKVYIDQYLSPCTKLKYYWFKDLCEKPYRLNMIDKKVARDLNSLTKNKTS